MQTLIFLFKAFYKIPIFQMLKKQSKISSPFSPIDSLKFSTFNYFGMGAVLASVAQSFWINFSAYYLNNILPAYGNVIFFLAQVSEGFGILFGWLILAKFGKPKSEQQKNDLNNTCYRNLVEGVNLYMLIYIIGAFLLVSCFPLVFLLTLSNPWLIFTFALLGKFGSGLMIISQLTIIPKITLNKNRRRKLVEKVAQYGLGGTFVSMFVMTGVSVYVNFIWKYFYGVCVFVFLGSLCSIVYVQKTRELIMMSMNEPKQKTVKISNQITQEPKTNKIIEWEILKSPKFYIYGIILICCTLYMDIVIAIFPYFVKSLNNVTHFKYLLAITALYLSSFIASLMTKNSFVFTGMRKMITIGLVSSILATVLFVIGLAQNQFDFLIIIATCLIGISKIIATNCSLNIINQFIGLEVKSSEFIYGIYYFIERIITGLILYLLIKKVSTSEEIQFLHVSEILIPFILYSLAWVLIMVDRTLNHKVRRRSHIIIIQPNKERRNNEEEDQDRVRSIQHQKIKMKQPISSKFADKSKKWVNKDLDSVK